MPVRRAIFLIGALAITAIVVACFPDIQFVDAPAADASPDTTTGGGEAGIDGGPSDGGSTSLYEGMVLVEGGSYPYARRPDGGVVTARLSHDFYIDIHEVSAKRLRAWVNDGGMNVPKNGATLDPGGPYESVMVWSSDYNTDVASRGFEGPGCDSGDFDGDASPTFARTAQDFPANCVNWAQAAAVCAMEGKRLLTEVEWYLVATNRGTTEYPWGNQTPDCSRATFAGACNFPRPLGATAAGKSLMYGVYDLAGSLRENVWNRYLDPEPLPDPFPIDYAGPPPSASDSRVVRGGWYYAGGDTIRPEDRSGFSLGATWDGHGFRCAKTKL